MAVTQSKSLTDEHRTVSTGGDESNLPVLLFVTPAGLRPSLPSRPARLLDAFSHFPQFGRVVAVHRLRPRAWLRSIFLRQVVGDGEAHAPGQIHRLIHPLPFGTAERRLLSSVVESYVRRGRPVVLWVADPKSAVVLEGRPAWTHSVVAVFDAYDAWDESPLVRGRVRRGAVQAGYEAAARHADVIFTNTQFMATRFRQLRARRVHLLPNGAPPVDRRFTPDLDEPYVIYVGRVHDRVDTNLLLAVARGHPRLRVIVAGPIEQEPNGWMSLVAEPNVRLLGVISGDEFSRLVGRARALLLPHRVSPYTLSQDAMKAWDALALGTPVISTRVPPAVDWPDGLAILADDGHRFAEAVSRVLGGDMDHTREERFQFAASNSWLNRAEQALGAIWEVRRAWP